MVLKLILLRIKSWSMPIASHCPLSGACKFFLFDGCYYCIFPILSVGHDCNSSPRCFLDGSALSDNFTMHSLELRILSDAYILPAVGVSFRLPQEFDKVPRALDRTGQDRTGQVRI
jgi:hypothetical protein